MLTLLLTRPAPQSAAFAAEIAACLPGRFRPVVSPLLAIVPAGALPDLAGIAALAFTSANGVAAYLDAGGTTSLPAYCVGPGTAAAAREAGFAARSADGDAAALAALIGHDRPGPVLHLRGRHAAADLAALLESRGIPARAAVVYDQRAVPPTPEVRRLGEAGGLDVVTAFSPRSARLLAEAAADWKLDRTVGVAISAAADAPLAAILPRARRVVAPRPDRDGMIEALAQL
jgi:uroporphyrinogen-III synthase